jgi:hypothetical protein
MRSCKVDFHVHTDKSRDKRSNWHGERPKNIARAVIGTTYNRVVCPDPENPQVVTKDTKSQIILGFTDKRNQAIIKSLSGNNNGDFLKAKRAL